MSQTYYHLSDMELKRRGWTQLQINKLRAAQKAESETKVYPDQPEKTLATVEPTPKTKLPFYTELGYPEYEGKYEPFETPEGYKVKEITKSPEGLEVSFEPSAPKGVAETMLSWDFPFYHGPSLMEVLGVKKKELPMTATSTEMARISGITLHPLAPIAAPIASVERTVYSIAQIVGIPSPRPPPTFIGGVIGKGLEAGLGWESKELERTMAYGPQYAIGTIFGDIFTSYVMGKAVEKTIIQPIAKVWKGSKPELWVIKHSELYAKRVAKGLTPQVVSYPTPRTVSLKGLEAQQLAWELSLTPRTSLVTITKVGAKRSVFTFTRGVGYTPMAVTLAKAMSVKEMGGRQALLQIEKPTRGKLPYLPSLTFKEPTTRLPQFLGIGLTVGLKGLPRPISIERPKRKERLKPFVSPIVSPITRTKESLVPVLESVQPQIVKQATIQKTVLKQLQIQKISLAPPRLTTITIRKPPIYRVPRMRDVSRDKRGLRGKWFLRTHPIKTHEQMMKDFFGEPKRRRKKRSKRKRKKK